MPWSDEDHEMSFKEKLCGFCVKGACRVVFLSNSIIWTLFSSVIIVEHDIVKRAEFTPDYRSYGPV